MAQITLPDEPLPALPLAPCPEGCELWSRVFPAADVGTSIQLDVSDEDDPVGAGSAMVLRFTQVSSVQGEFDCDGGFEPGDPYALVSFDGQQQFLELPDGLFAVPKEGEPLPALTRVFAPGQTSVDVGIEIWDRDTCSPDDWEMNWPPFEVDLTSNWVWQDCIHDGSLDVTDVCWETESGPQGCFPYLVSFVPVELDFDTPPVGDPPWRCINEPGSVDVRSLCFSVDQQYINCSPYSAVVASEPIFVDIGASGTFAHGDPTDDHVPSFEGHYEVSVLEAGEVVFPNTRVCFDWSTSYVDEAFGEDVGGDPVACSTAADCCAPGEPCPAGRCAGGTCTYEQSYPARFAEYELLLDGPFGSATLGEYYDDMGQAFGLGQRRYLDEDGCIPASVLPPGLLLQPDDGSDAAALSLRARVRTKLGVSDGAPPAYDVAYADIDPASALDDLTAEVVEFELPTSKPELVEAGWVSIAIGVDEYLRPPTEVRLRSRTLTPLTNMAAALGLILNDPDGAHPGGTLVARFGEGSFPFTIDGKTCATVNDCVPLGAPTCSAGTCEHTFDDSAYSFTSKTLGIGRAQPDVNADSCATDSDCGRAQVCLTEAQEPCSGAPCFCHWADSSRWRSVVLHEAGHQLQDFNFGVLGTPHLRYQLPCGASGSTFCDEAVGYSTMCGCAHIESANSAHCLQSVESFSDAFVEGFGQFSTARIINRSVHSGAPTEQDCTFPYYKEVLGADVVGAVNCATAPEGVCEPVGGQNMALAPVPIDCGSPLAWRDTFCPAPGAPTPVDVAQLATEHDILQFLWTIYAKAPQLDMAGISTLMQTTCGGAFCTFSDVLVWPSAPTGTNEVSLQEGAEASFGADAVGLAAFNDAAFDHGITPDSIP